MKAELRPVTPDDVLQFVGEPSPYRMRGLAGVVDGEVIGLGGIALLPDQTAIAFVHLSDEARKHPILLHRAALTTLADAKARGIRKIIAMADDDQPAAERWLIRLGFRREEIEGMKVYTWQN